MKKLLKKSYFLPLATVVFLIFLILIGIKTYDAAYNQAIENTLSQKNTYTPKKAMKNPVLLEVNQLFKLFPDQNVTIAKIADIKALSSKYPVFKNARNGDYLIFYPKLTIIYDPRSKTIINMVNMNLFK